jgi:hypothetical protein
VQYPKPRLHSEANTSDPKLSSEKKAEEMQKRVEKNYEKQKAQTDVIMKLISKDISL